MLIKRAQQYNIKRVVAKSKAARRRQDRIPAVRFYQHMIQVGANGTRARKHNKQ